MRMFDGAIPTPRLRVLVNEIDEQWQRNVRRVELIRGGHRQSQ